ncbi:DUF2145 domain-containing protein [Maricaulis parjimensis]|uniref:DUF2145 domain-containing protein n=1 Tax=Maricaulis parjimensis TaxID=144023 RepID=UPI001EEDF31C|nr:DUF2145 domain-containing protein [Maricaulis parjimensis]
MRALIRSAGALTALALALAAPMTAEAGSGAVAIPPWSVEEAADFSKQIERDLAARGARVALVFRSGRAREDLPDGVRYTHGAFWVYSELETEDGRRVHGYAVHNLYHYEDDRRSSYLAQDWPLNFTQGDVIGEVGVIIPSPEMQRRLEIMLNSGADDALHQPDYSLVSNPHDLRFQNCNEYLLDVIAAAAWETTNREQIKANLEAWFEPAPIRAGLLARIFGPSADKRLRMDDQSGTIRTTTFSALANFLGQYQMLSDHYEIRADFLGPVPPTG